MDQKRLGKIALVLGLGLLTFAAVLATGCGAHAAKNKIVCNSAPEYWSRDRNGQPVTEIRLCFGEKGKVYRVGAPVTMPKKFTVVKEAPKKLMGVKEAR